MNKYSSAVEAYLDNELDQSDRAKLEQLAATDPQLKAELDRQSAVRAELNKAALLKKVKLTNETAYRRFQKKNISERRTRFAIILLVSILFLGILISRFCKNPFSPTTHPEEQPIQKPVEKSKIVAQGEYDEGLVAKKKRNQLAEKFPEKNALKSGWRSGLPQANPPSDTATQLYDKFYKSILTEATDWPNAQHRQTASILKSKINQVDASIALPDLFLAVALPDSVLLLRGAFYLETDQMEKAEQDLSRLANPQKPLGETANWMLAFVYLLQNEPSLARQSFQNCSGKQRIKADSILQIIQQL